jgi:hypothetical protein
MLPILTSGGLPVNAHSIGACRSASPWEPATWRLLPLLAALLEAGRRATEPARTPNPEKMSPGPPRSASKSVNLALKSISQSMGAALSFWQESGSNHPFALARPIPVAILSARRTWQMNRPSPFHALTQVSAPGNPLLSEIGESARCCVPVRRGRTVALTRAWAAAIVAVLHPERAAVGRAKGMRESFLETLW